MKKHAKKILLERGLFPHWPYLATLLSVFQLIVELNAFLKHIMWLYANIY